MTEPLFYDETEIQRGGHGLAPYDPITAVRLNRNWLRLEDRIKVLLPGAKTKVETKVVRFHADPKIGMTVEVVDPRTRAIRTVMIGRVERLAQTKGGEPIKRRT